MTPLLPRVACVLAAALVLSGCDLLERTDTPDGDAGVDVGPALDAGPLEDAGPSDAGPSDAGPDDAGPADAGPIDAGPLDAGPADAGPTGGSLAELFLTRHNQVRAGAQPAPDPALPPLTWSVSVASVAQSWAAQCQFSHNAGRGALGENIYATTASGTTPTQVVDAWASEAPDYDYATNSCATGRVCGHYTQLVWRSTLALGCARQACTTNSPFGSGAWTFFVCNYDPPGNFVGQRPY